MAYYLNYVLYGLTNDRGNIIQTGFRKPPYPLQYLPREYGCISWYH